MGQTIRDLKLKVIVDSKGAVTGLRTVKGDIVGVGSASETTATRGKSLTSVFKGITPATLGVAGAVAALTAGLKAAISGAINFEKGLREVSTLMGGMTSDELRDMGQQLKVIAVRSGQALDVLTKAQYDIVSAGFADAAQSAKVLASSADLAVGGVTEVSTAADLLTTTLNAYSLSADDATTISDKLFTIVRLGKTTMTELGGSMGRVLAIAGQAGVSLDEVGAAAATLTAQGQSTEEATTAIRAAIVELLKPAEDLEGAIRDLGYTSGTALIDQQGFAGAIGLIAEQAAKTGTPLTDLFTNVRSMQAVLPLTGTAASGFAENLDQMRDSAGAAAAAVGDMENTASLQLARMKSAFAVIGEEIGLRFVPIIASAAEAVANLLAPEVKDLQGEIDDLDERIRQMGDGMSYYGGVVVDNTAHLQKLKDERAVLLEQLEQERIAQEKLARIQEEIAARLAILTEAEQTQTQAAELGIRVTKDQSSELMEHIPPVEKLTKAKRRLKQITETLGLAENEAVQTFLSSLSSQLSGLLSLAIAKALSKEGGKGLLGLATGAAAAAGFALLFSKFVPKAASGLEMAVRQPTLIMAGEAGQEEQVSIQPTSRGGVGRGDTIIFDFRNAIIPDRESFSDYVRMDIVPELDTLRRRRIY